MITADDKDITLFVGGPAGARRTAVRLGGDDKVYAVTGLTAYTVGSEPIAVVEKIQAISSALNPRSRR